MTVRRISLLLASWLILGLVSTAYAQGSLAWTLTAGPTGGFANTLALVPNTPGMIYAGSDSGVYLTRDDGARWTLVSQGLPSNPTITALAVVRAPNVVLAGTHNGIYRTQDAGATWTSVDPRLSQQIIHAFLIDPQAPNRIYAATANTVLRSENAGDTWTDVGADLKSTRVWALAFSRDANRLYAATDSGLYVSEDRGARWRFLSDALPSGVRLQSLVVTTRGLLVGTNQGLYQSRDGRTWSALGGSLADAFARPLVNDPQQPDRVLAVLPQGIVKTTDGGATWSLLANPLRDLPIRSLVLADKNTIYAGTARGVMKSSDEGATWQVLDTGFVATIVHQLVAYKQPPYVLAATAFGVYRTTDRGNTWSEARGLTDPYVLCLAQNPATPNEIYAGTWSSGVFVSRDNGATFTRVTENVANRAPISSLLVQSTAGQNPILWAGTLGSGLLKSVDAGQTWQTQTNGLSGVTRVTALAATPTHLYAATERGLYRLAIHQANSSWTGLAPSLPTDEASALVFDPQRPQILYAGFTANGVYRSEDGGTRWSPTGAFPTPARLKTLAFNPTMPSVIYAGTDRGVFRSEDSGSTWALANEGLPLNALVPSIVVDPSAPEYILAGTYGNGMVRGIDRPRSDLPLVTLILLGFLAFGLLGLMWYRYWSPPAQERAVQRMWKQWEAAIAHALLTRGEAHAGNLKKLPQHQLAYALKRYMEEHPHDALTWQENPPYLRADNFALTQRFLATWKAAWELVDNEQAFASVTSQIVDQLCVLLGFTRLEERSYKGLIGYVVRAPALRLKIPPRFPIIFIPRHQAREEDLEALRDLMGILNMVSYFALVIDLRDAPPSEPRRSLAHLLRQATHDFIVLDGQAIRRLLATRDQARALVEIILSQVDLTVVSPYVTSGPVPANMFFGREAELKTIVRTVRDTNFAIVGGRKIGKTSILARVLQLLQEAPEYHPLYLDCQAVHSYEDFFEAVDTMWRMALPAPTPEGFRRMATDLPMRYPARTVVMLFDEIDGLLAYDLAQGEPLFRIFRALSHELPIRFVFCGEKVLNSALHNPHLAFFNFCNRMVLSYLTREEARRVVTDPMQEMGITLEEDGDLASRIIDYAACHPNMVQYLCQKLIERINQRRERLIRQSDVEAIGESTEFAEYFAEVLWGSTTPLERLITLLMLQYPTVTLDEMAQVLRASNLIVPPERLDEAFEGLTLYSILRRRGPHYTFAAPTLANVLQRGQDAHSTLATYLQELQTMYGAQQ